MNKQDILKKLNPQQVEAVTQTEGKIRVIAGAGSGKTRVLTNRYAYLVECLGIDPAHILCMTFTNKAAQEMKRRIQNMIALGKTNDYICTIHGLCVKILRKEIYRIGYPQNFMIFDEDDCKSLMKQVMEELEITKQTLTVNQLLQSVAKSKFQTDYINCLLPNSQWPENTPDPAFYRYIQLQQKYFALDFNDLILFTLYILNNFPDALNFWQNEFDYIQIDEVQDCSQSDWKIIETLSYKCGNLFIVGDPDQAIYEWRGAKPEFFVNYKADSDIVLDENYRSTPNILDVANSIIKNNVYRIDKSLKTQTPADAIVVHKHAKDEEEEGEWIASLISNMIKKGTKPNDFAILYRASNQSRFIEQALMNKQLPYTIWGGIRFFERKEIKDCLAYLRLLQTGDDVSLKRIINVPSRKFGKTKLQHLEMLAKKEKRSLLDTLSIHINEKPFNLASMKEFIELIEELKSTLTTSSISELLSNLLNKSGLLDFYRNDEDEERIENIKELMNSIYYYEQINSYEDVTLDKYLQDIALFTNSDYKKDTSTIKLMTIHQAKGLEFPYVFVIGVTEGIFPSHRSIRERKIFGLEEERRLMYVAITRAEKALFLTESEGYNFSTKSSKYPSRFISEIGKDLIKVDGQIDQTLLLERDNLITQLETDSNEELNDFKDGDIVEHETFGKGVVLSVNNDGQSCEVDFNGKIRNILWKFLKSE